MPINYIKFLNLLKAGRKTKHYCMVNRQRLFANKYGKKYTKTLTLAVAMRLPPKIIAKMHKKVFIIFLEFQLRI